MKNCPNKKCGGEVKILYKSSIKKDLDINFDCTTNTYDKPQLNICNKCELIYPEIIILDKRDKFLKYESLNLINYCKEFNGDVFLMFVKKK